MFVMFWVIAGKIVVVPAIVSKMALAGAEKLATKSCKVDFLEFSEDYVFSSPSTAAAIVMGRNANGLSEWKLKNGITLKEFEASEN